MRIIEFEGELRIPISIRRFIAAFQVRYQIFCLIYSIPCLQLIASGIFFAFSSIHYDKPVHQLSSLRDYDIG
jgi:hypothetical protein